MTPRFGITYSPDLARALVNLLQHERFSVELVESASTAARGPTSLGSVEQTRVMFSVLGDRVASAPYGLLAGAMATGRDAELFKLLLRTSRTPRGALASASTYLPLLGSAWRLTLEETAERATVRIEVDNVLAHLDTDLILGVLQELISLTHATVLLRRGCPSDLQIYKRALGETKIEFDAPFNGFCFESSWLDREWSSSEPRFHALLRSLADATIPVGLDATWAERVQTCIVQRLAQGALRLEHVAKSLGVHPRKLRRRLNLEGKSFRDLVDDVRREQSLELLANSNRRIREVAQMMGFVAPSPFVRAFRRWTQLTPIEYRRQIRARRRSVPALAPELRLGPRMHPGEVGQAYSYETQS